MATAERFRAQWGLKLIPVSKRGGLWLVFRPLPDTSNSGFDGFAGCRAVAALVQVTLGNAGGLYRACTVPPSLYLVSAGLSVMPNDLTGLLPVPWTPT